MALLIALMVAIGANPNPAFAASAGAIRSSPPIGTHLIPTQATPESPSTSRMSVPKVIIVPPGGRAALPIELGAIETLPRNSLVRLRGAPEGLRLSDGHLVSRGDWAIPIKSLPGLHLTVPRDMTGQAGLHVSLTTVDGRVLAEVRITLVVAETEMAVAGASVAPKPGEQRAPAAGLGAPPPPSPPPAAKAAPQPLPAPPKLVTPVRPEPSPEALARARTLLARGERALGEGAIVDARQYLERAAELGLGAAALMLGATYDAAELQRLGALGVQPDPAKARIWYEKAYELGVTEAGRRLTRLGRGK